MTDPERLLESGSTREREVLAGIRAYRTPPGAHRQLLGRAGRLAFAGLLASKLAAAGGAILSVKGAVAAGLVVAGAGVWMGVSDNSPAPEPSRPAAVQRSVPPPEPTVPSALPADPVVSPPLPSARPLPSRATNVTPKPAVSNDAASEVEFIEGVRRSIREGHPREALAALGDYRKRFSERRLGLEAEALEIEALAQSGDTARARARARAFLERHPNSLLAERVRKFAD